MYFLIPIFDKRNADGNYDTDDSENYNSQEWKPKTEDEHTFEQVNDHAVTHTTMQSPSNLRNKNKQDIILAQILGILRQNQKGYKKQTEEEDDDTKFLLSFRTHMKNMDENQKIEFKLGMLQLLKKIST